MENKPSLPDTSTDNSYQAYELHLPDSDIKFPIYLKTDEFNRSQQDPEFLQELCIKHQLLHEQNLVEIKNETQVIRENGECPTPLLDIWTDKETKLLIMLYGEHNNDFQQARIKKHVWMIISEKLSSNGIFKSADKCQRKWLNLVRVYRSIKEKHSRTGQHRICFRYFDLLEELLGSKPSDSIETFMVDVGIAIHADEKICSFPNEEVIEQNAENAIIINNSIPEKMKSRKNYSQEHFKTKKNHLVRKEAIKKKMHKEHMEMVAKRHKERMKIEAEQNSLLKQILEKLQS